VSGSARIPGNFPALLQRLAVVAPELTFDLLGVVMPVSLVDTGVSIPTTTLPPLTSAPASSGEATWGAASSPADTGPLTAGNWFVRFVWGSTSVAGTMRFGKRDAANAAFVWSQFADPRMGQQLWVAEFSGFFTVAENERFRMDVVIATGNTGQGSIWATKVS